MSISLRTQQLQFDPQNFVQYQIFFPLIIGDIGLIVLTILIWKFVLWVPINKLRIRNIKQNIWYQIGPDSSIFTTLEYLRNILKTLSQPANYIIEKCGFEAFTILYFQRKIALILTVLCITDFCIWIPYQLFFTPISQFSFKKMESVGNDDFRTFYTIWVATLILYSLNHMQNYLRMQLVYNLYRNPQQRILNNLKAKTLYVNFLGQKYYTEAEVKAYTQQYLVEEMGVQDRILAVLTIPNYFQHLQIEYKLKIIQIISQLKEQGHQFSRFWQCLKGKGNEQIQVIKNQIIQELQKHIRNTPSYIEGCFIIVSEMQTAQGLCRQFQSTKALTTVCPQFYYGQSQQEFRLQNRKLIVTWAQEPNDIMWINMTLHTRQILNFLIFNVICTILLLFSFSSIILLPSYKLPFLKAVQSIIPAILNSTLRFFISKMVQFEKKLFRSEQQMKQFNMLCVYFFVNLILGSLFRDVTNLTSLLQTGWGFIEVIKLIYRKIDGLFYYLFIFNQMTFTFIDILLRPGQLFLDCFDSNANYQKCTKVKQDSTYGQNDAFRFGYYYATDIIVLAIIILYSVSNPLIHFFGVIFFYTRYHLNGYALLTFHSENVNSNNRLITKVVQYTSIMIGIWVFLTATSLIFQKKYSNSIILYLYCGVVIYLTAVSSKLSSINDVRTEEDIKTINLSKYIQQWKISYRHPFRPQKYLKQHEDD